MSMQTAADFDRIRDKELGTYLDSLFDQEARVQTKPIEELPDAVQLGLIEKCTRELCSARAKLSAGREYNAEELAVGMLVDYYPILLAALNGMASRIREAA